MSDPKNPSYLLIANNPETESIIDALNVLILNRLVTRVNSGQGKNGAMNIQEAEEFKTSKFFCKTNFDMEAIKAAEEDYKNYPLPIFYDFKSTDAKERILYNKFYHIDTRK